MRNYYSDCVLAMPLYNIFVCFLFDLILYIPSTIFQLNRDGSSWVEPELSWDKCLTQGPQRSDADEAWTHGPSVSSQALYHCAPPLHNIKFCFMQNFNILASLCSWAGWFEFYLVGTQKTGFLALRPILQRQKGPSLAAYTNMYTDGTFTWVKVQNFKIPEL